MIELRPLVPADFPLLSSWFASEEDAVQWGGPQVSYPLTSDQLESMLAGAEADPPARRCWMALQDGAVIGHAQLIFDWRNGNATLARVVVAPRSRGQGLAASMLRPVLREAFTFERIYRLELNVYSFNEPAIRAHRALGFQL